MTQSAFEKLTAQAKKNISELTLDQVAHKREKGDKFVLIDVREAEEWAEGYIPGAIHLGKGVIERDIEDEVSDRHAEIVLYCGGGSRSALAAENLQRMGYDHVHSMIGGYRGWAAKGWPTQKD